MPSLRKKVAGFMRQLSISNLAGAVENIGHGEQPLRSPRSITQDFSTGCFITRYLDGLERKEEGPPILNGRNPNELPAKSLGDFHENNDVFAALTGPDTGLTAVNVQQKHLSINDIDIDYIDTLDSSDQFRGSTAPPIATIAGIPDWFIPRETAYGIATTLYEKNPTTNTNNGEPIADCFGIVARPGSAVLALADGVNWGTKASIAARSAIHGCMEYLNTALYCPPANNDMTTTKDVFIALLRSFHAAHSLILQEQGMLTTLTVCAVLPLSNSNSSTQPKKYVACTCNVGDSLAYVYSRNTGVREITRDSHDIYCMRDMRDALGALGPVDGCNPELNNLTLAMTEVEDGDIVFLTSDGISDNFDPVVGKFAILPCHTSVPDPSVRSLRDTTAKTRRKSADNLRQTDSGNSNSNRNRANLPVVEAYQRHELTLLRMEDLLRKGVSGEGPPCSSAKHLCELLLDFAVRITAAKRRILEDTDLYYAQNKDGQLVQLSKQEQRVRRKKTLDKDSMIPGKLDHATVVAYVVGSYNSGHDL